VAPAMSDTEARITSLVQAVNLVGSQELDPDVISEHLALYTIRIAAKFEQYLREGL
jgi:hypothetical protein